MLKTVLVRVVTLGILQVITADSESFCDIPLKPEHGSVLVAGSDGRIPAGRIALFFCNDGRILNGSALSKCLDNGQWTSPTPQCLEVCSVPKVTEGIIGRYVREGHKNETRVFKQVEVGERIEDDEELFLRCSEGNEASGSENKEEKIICSRGKWSREAQCEPKVRCEKPKSPDHGSVQMNGDPTVGSLALYFCDEGTTIVGHSKSKCLISGNWTFDPPKCLRSCKIPAVENAEIGQYQIRTIYRYPRTHFVKFQVGDSVNHSETVTVRCKQGLTPVSDSLENKDRSDQATCNDGEWSNLVKCQEKDVCHGEPPAIANGSPVIGNRQHGQFIWYRCDKGFEKTKAGRVECIHGTWKGEPPVCSDTRCHTSRLNFPGLIKPKKEHFRRGEAFEIKCERGYIKSFFSRRMACSSNGKWSIEDNPCTIERCEDEPPQILNGRIRNFTREHGSMLYYECNEPFEKIGSSTVRCEIDRWEGEPPSCRESQKNRETSSATEPGRTSTGQAQGVTPAESIDPSDLQFDECFCTYDYRTDVLTATVDTRTLQREKRIEKGETLSLSCLYSGTILVWPSGLRIFGTVNLPCNTCQHWQTNDLPTCEATKAGDSLIIYRNNMKLLPGGIIEIPKAKSIEFQCMNSWLQPVWFIGNRKEIYLSGDDYETFRRNGFFSAYMNISAMDDEHSGVYECSTLDGYGYYRTAFLNLKIAEPDIQCPELETNTKKGNFTIVYEANRVVNSKAHYSCKDNTKKIIGSNVRRCTENGSWSGSYPSCEGMLCHGEPPAIENGSPVIGSRQHGSVIWYRCNKGFFRTKGGRVECIHGTWKGETSVCSDTRCHTSQLNFQGLVKPEKAHFTRGEAFEIKCERGYRKSTSSKRMACSSNGKWSIEDNPCTIERCEDEPPQILNGRISNFTREHGSVVYYECNEHFEKIGSSTVRCVIDRWEGQPPFCRESEKSRETSSVTEPGITSTGHAYSVTPAETIDPSDLQFDKCFCTYDYPTDVLWATADTRTLQGEKRIEKGETLSLRCLYPGTSQVWPSGLRFSGTVNLTCNTCRHWRYYHIPTCEPTEAGDSLIIYSNKMKLLPGGIIEIPKAKSVLFQCVNSWSQPIWNTGRRKGISFVVDDYKASSRNGFFSGYMNISETDDEHSGTYECATHHGYRRYKSAILNLKITEPDIQCPELERNTKKGNFTIVYENNREVNSKVYYSCKDNTQKLIGSNVRRCTENGSWSGSYPSCENCERFQSSPGLEVSYSDDVRVGSTASFRCSPPNTLIGNSFAMCQSSGTWSHDLPSCVESKCSIETLVMSILPESVVPDISEESEEFLSPGSELGLQCEDGSILTGSSKAICGSLGRWEVGNVRCVPGCRLSKDAFANLLIEPVKESYRFGEFILVSCPPGLRLTSEVERIMCLGKTWSDDIPNCTSEGN